jgi:hypothetical protein
MNKNSNPMGLVELRELLGEITSSLKQIRDAMDTMQGEPNSQGLLATLYTRTLMVKLRVQADMEKLS